MHVIIHPLFEHAHKEELKFEKIKKIESNRATKSQHGLSVAPPVNIRTTLRSTH